LCRNIIRRNPTISVRPDVVGRLGRAGQSGEATRRASRVQCPAEAARTGRTRSPQQASGSPQPPTPPLLTTPRSAVTPTLVACTAPPSSARTPHPERRAAVYHSNPRPVSAVTPAPRTGPPPTSPFTTRAPWPRLLGSRRLGAARTGHRADRSAAHGGHVLALPPAARPDRAARPRCEARAGAVSARDRRCPGRQTPASASPPAE
jgi:hypothetical protein